MKYSFITILLVFIALIFTNCGKQSAVEEGLPYSAYIARANQYHNENKDEKAIPYYKKALEIKPAAGDVHYILGEIYDSEYKKSYDSAWKQHSFDVLTHRKPNEFYIKGDTKELEKYGLKKEYKELAMQEFRQTIKYEPQNWMARYRVASDLLSKQQYKEAIQEYEKVIELNPKYVNAYSLMGEAYMKEGSLDLAVKWIKKALELDTNSEYDYYNLGLVYRKMLNGDEFNKVLAKLKSMHSFFYDELRLSIYR